MIPGIVSTSTFNPWYHRSIKIYFKFQTYKNNIAWGIYARIFNGAQTLMLTLILGIKILFFRKNCVIEFPLWQLGVESKKLTFAIKNV